MMNLVVQIFSMFFSFIYGVFLYFMFVINYKYLFRKKYRLKLFYYFAMFLFVGLFYFVVLNHINNGILHLYFLLLLIFGFLVSYNFYKNKRK